MGAVEDPDLPTGGQPLGVAPQKVMVELLRRRHLETMHGDALRVHATHHVTDRPVLTRRVERLQDDQHAVGVLRREPGLILA